MKIVKRNQLIILVMSLMLITAGYLNFDANSSAETGKQISEVGDATLVSVIPEMEKLTESLKGDEEETNNEQSKQEQEEVETASKAQDEYFIKSKLERDSMYSQMLETYQEIHNNSNSTAEQRTEAVKEITNISNTKNAIMIAENLIMAKRI